MKGSHINDDQLHQQDDLHQNSDHMPLPSSTREFAWIALVSAHLQNYYQNRIHAEDIHILDFSLQQIFSHITWLYQHGLPILSHETTTPFRDQLAHQFACWQHLRALLHTLERLKVIAHLLNVTTMSIIHTLNNVTPPTYEQATSSAPFTHFAQEEEAWTKAFQDLGEHLRDWQRNYTACSPFSTQFSPLALPASSLEVIDSSFDALLIHGSTLFGDVLSDLRATSIDDDEALSTCLLDLLQQNDALLIATDTVIEPLNALLQYHAITAVLR